MPSSIDHLRDHKEIKQMITDLEAVIKGFSNPQIVQIYKKEIAGLKQILGENPQKLSRGAGTNKKGVQ